MRRRYLVGAIGAACAAILVRSLLSSAPDSNGGAGIVRVAEPAVQPAAVAAPATPPTLRPSPTPAGEPGLDPPPPPQEKNSPDYAKLGVQPAI